MKNFARGDVIAGMRKKMGMSQEEFAEKIGIGRQALSAIEHGGDFRVSVLKKIAKELRCTADELLFDRELNDKTNIEECIVNEIRKMELGEMQKWYRILCVANEKEY